MSSKSNQLTVRSEKGKIWSHIRNKWLDETPEERVRQQYLCVLVNEYGFSLDQMAEELEVTGRGSGHARADFVIWRTQNDKTESRNPLIIVECKSDNVRISGDDYGQGDNYARLTNARFFVTHNNQETRYWRVLHERMPKTLEEIESIPHATSTDKEIEELIKRLKVFKEDEFANLLHDCHNVIRNREKKDPAAAFDEIAKLLFIKVYVERELTAKRHRKNVFTVEYLQEQLGDDPIQDLFTKTKRAYSADKIFDNDEQIKLKPNTTEQIIRLLERYNLSDTSEDIKGIAFERFLGRTFRGEIGQFFTPRSIVEFMIRMIDPKEGDIICDPASGSGGFLIRFFEIVRQQILSDADQEYQEYKASIEATTDLSDEEKALKLRKKYDQVQKTIDQKVNGSRLWQLANRSIYGTDANDRMARTSKMNMIMHGDGHGGVHHHDGFINVNGIFEERFDIVLTNPPFGSDVEKTDTVTQPTTPPEVERRYIEEYGDLYTRAQDRVRAVANHPQNKSIASLFTLPKASQEKIKTEILFLERCLDLLKPGGRLGIVLPEGIFNNPSLAYVREFCEDRAFILAVVSLPPETFKSAGADVKASLLFLKKFTNEEKQSYDSIRHIAIAEVDAKYWPEIDTETTRLKSMIFEAKKARDKAAKAEAEKELREFLKRMAETKKSEARLLLKQRFAYPVFLYEAEKVGITSTGEADDNELYPNERVPEGIEKTCLELFFEFEQNPEAFFLGDENPFGAFAVQFESLRVWSVGSFFNIKWTWPIEYIKPLSSVLRRKQIEILGGDKLLGDVQLITIHFDGSVEVRDTEVTDEVKGKLFAAQPGDVVYSKIDVRHGAIGIIPGDITTGGVSSEFPVYEVDNEQVLTGYIQLVFQTRYFRKAINSMISGASGRKRVQPSQIETLSIPIPPITIQRTIVEYWNSAQKELNQAFLSYQDVIDTVNRTFYSLHSTSDEIDVLKSRFFALDWANVPSWDTKTARASMFRLANPSFKPMSDVAEEATELVHPQAQPEKDWPVYGVNNKEGVFFSYHQKGSDFNAAYKRIKKDWFFHNPTRSSVGSLGIVPDVPEDALTSPEYQVWRLKEGTIHGYIAALIATEFFIRLIQFHRVGAVKQRLYVENLLQIPVPVLSIEEQETIALARENALSRIAQAKHNLQIAKDEIEAMILGEKPVVL